MPLLCDPPSPPLPPPSINVSFCLNASGRHVPGPIGECWGWGALGGHRGTQRGHRTPMLYVPPPLPPQALQWS